MSELTQARLRAAVIIIAPVVGLIGATVHPYIGDLEDNAETARVIADDTTRWAWAHVIEMGGNALFVLAVIAIGSYLRASGERLWRFIAVPLITVAVVLLTAVYGMALTFAAVIETGASLETLEEIMEGLDPWYLPITLGILAAFGLGFLSLAVSIYRSHVLGRRLTWVVAGAIVVSTFTILIPATWGEQVFNVVAIVAFWPLAYQMWRDTAEAPMVAAAAPGAPAPPA